MEYFNEGFKLELSRGEYKRSFYYLTNYKDTELTVARNVIETMKRKGLIDENDFYRIKAGMKPAGINAEINMRQIGNDYNFIN